MRQAVHDRNDTLSATSAFSLKGSLWENNKGCFLATQTSVMQAVIRAVTTYMPCCAILGGVGSGKTGYPPLFSLVVNCFVCVHAKQSSTLFYLSYQCFCVCVCVLMLLVIMIGCIIQSLFLLHIFTLSCLQVRALWRSSMWLQLVPSVFWRKV